MLGGNKSPACTQKPCKNPEPKIKSKWWLFLGKGCHIYIYVNVYVTYLHHFARVAAWILAIGTVVAAWTYHRNTNLVGMQPTATQTEIVGRNGRQMFENVWTMEIRKTSNLI
jgi:hypothetical protein